jgi:hypothetical protein
VLTTDDARSSLALAIYALAAGRVLRRPCHQVELHHLPTGEVISWTHTDESLLRHLGRAEDIADECAAADERMRSGSVADSGAGSVSGSGSGAGSGAGAGSGVGAGSGSGVGLPPERYDEVFPPRPRPSCGWCDYLRHCPAGAAAAVRRRPWDGLSLD